MAAADYEGGLHKLCSQGTQRRLSSTRALPSRVASRTPLYEWHRAAGARFIEFGGWEMPLQYFGIVDEHLTVRQAVGLFDVSHMGKIFVEGSTAHAFLDRLSANDVPTSPGRARYTHLLREDGTILDDVIVTCLASNRFLLVCNAGPRVVVWSWLKTHATADVVLTDRTTERLCLALQGPRAPGLLQRFTSIDLSRVKPFAGVTIDFVPPAPWGARPRAVPPEIEGWGKSDAAGPAIPPVRDPSVAGGRASFLVTRTGYTGEAGVEAFPSPAGGVWVWESVPKGGGGEMGCGRPRHPAGAGPLRCRWTGVVPRHPNRLHGRGGVRALSYRGGGIVGLGIAPEVRGGPRDPADRPRRAGHPSPGERLPVVRTRFRRTPDAPRGELRLGREMGPAVHWSRGA